MANDRLTTNEVAMLFALMAEAREVPNTELKQRYGLSLDGEPRRKLNGRKLVESRKVGRGFAHLLTDAGWARCREELTGPCPPRAGTPGGALYAVLHGLHRYLERSDLSLSDVFRPEGDATAVTAPTARRSPSVELEAQIRVAYQKLRTRPGGWVGLAELRPLVVGATRAEVDAALVRLGRIQGVTLVPEDNQKALRAEDRTAALRVGGRDHHYLSIEDA